jgi:signal transduction histidine kinase
MPFLSKIKITTKFKLMLAITTLPAVILLLIVFTQPFIGNEKINNIVLNNEIIYDVDRIFPQTVSHRRELFANKEDYLKLQYNLYQSIANNDTAQVNNNQVKVEYLRGYDNLPIEFYQIILMALFVLICSIVFRLWQIKVSVVSYLFFGGIALFHTMLISAILTLPNKVFHPFLHLSLGTIFALGQILFLTFIILTALSFPKKLINNKWVKYILLFVFVIFAYELLHRVSPIFDITTIYISDFSLYLWILLSYLLGIITITTQLIVNKNHPQKFKQAKYLLLPLIIIPTIFTLLRVVPFFTDYNFSIDRVSSYVIVVFIYLSLLFGVLRFNLFNAKQQVKIATILTTFTLFIIFSDIVFVYLLLNIESIIIVIVLFWLYLILRAKLEQYFYNKHQPKYSQYFNYAISTINNNLQNIDQKLWMEILSAIFNPIAIKEVNAIKKYQFKPNALFIPSTLYSSALIIEYAEKGIRMFNKNDINLVQELEFLLSNLNEFKTAFYDGKQQERQRIAKDLHDRTGHLLLSILYTAKSEQTKQLAQQGIQQLKEIINSLVKDNVEIHELLSEIKQISQDFLNKADIDLIYNQAEFADNLQISGENYLHILNILYELLNNIAKHSQTKQVNLNIKNNNNLTIEIIDNGIGFDVNNVKLGNGINNINQRVTQMGGKIFWDKAIIIWIALNKF